MDVDGIWRYFGAPPPSPPKNTNPWRFGTTRKKRVWPPAPPPLSFRCCVSLSYSLPPVLRTVAGAWRKHTKNEGGGGGGGGGGRVLF
eukprot:COSAG06_NODE_58862_length_276_cov_0.536723_1_plen_86_part_10